MFEHAALLWLLAASPLVALPGVIAALRGRPGVGTAAAALRLGAFAALVLAFAGLGIEARVAATRVEVAALIDQSRSVAPDQQGWMRSRVRELARAMSARDGIAVFAFGRDVRLLSPLADPRLAATPRIEVDGGATDIAGALIAAEGVFSPDADKRIYLLSDGNETAGDARTEIAALAGDGVRVFAASPPPSMARRLALTAFEGPEAVRADQRFNFILEIQSEAAGPVNVGVELLRDGARIGRETIRLVPGLNRFELPLRIERPGAYLMQARLEVPVPLAAVNSEMETALTVLPEPRVLVVAGNPPESLLKALKLRNYKVDLASPRGLPTRAQDYLPYQTVIVADASADSLSAAAADALRRYVADYAGGLIATGETLRDDRFAGTPLEKVLPVKFKPQPLPPSREPIAVYLCIDRSNSMSYDSRYPAVRNGERIRYAKAAAIALLRQLDDTDYAGVIAFDSQPYVLSHLEPLGQNRAALEYHIERLEPGGGTDFKEALEIAERETLASGIAVHRVFLLTDGDTNRPYHDHDDLMLSFAREHIPVSTIRIGPDLANLRLLEDFARMTGGAFYRVQDIERLPLLLVGLMRQTIDRRATGRATVEPGESSAILAGINRRSIPPIEDFAATEPKRDAQTPLKVRRGDSAAPLLVTWQYGLGRSVVFSADPDSLSALNWIQWDRYAQFWSQLVAWTMREGDAGMFTVRVKAARDGAVSIAAEKADSAPVNNLMVRIAGQHYATDIAMTQIDASLYRAEPGPLPRGKYTAALMIKDRDMERVLLKRAFASAGSRPADADELRLRPPNLALLDRLASASEGRLGAQPAEVVKPAGKLVTVRQSARPYLLSLAMALFLGEVFVRRRLLRD